MIFNLNNAFMDYIKDRKNLPLICILAAVILVIIVLAIIMIVRAVNNKKRNRSETEEAVRALANVPPDEEYLPYTPAEGTATPAQTAEAPAPATVVVTEPEPAAEETAQPAKETPQPAEETPQPAEETPQPVEEKPVEEEKKEAVIAEEKTEEENKMAGKQAPAKKEPAKKPEAPKVSAANGKWVIEEVKSKYWLSLIAPNGQVMLESPTPYASIQSARSGVKTYQDNIAADKLEITEHKNGDSQVQVFNGRGGLLATSSTYSSRAQAESARDSIKRWASTTAIEEVAEKKD